jgi:hypothetical protein
MSEPRSEGQKPKFALKRVLLEAICYDLRILLTLILLAFSQAGWPGRPTRRLILAL